MALADTFAALEATPISMEMAESAWLFPTVESVHVLAVTLVVGAILVVDLRLAGLASRGRSARQLADRILPITWAAFGLAVVSGVLLFLAKPVSYSQNVFFLFKLGALALAGLNMAAFHFVVDRDRTVAEPPAAARYSGFASLAIWVGVVALGRWIGFTV